MQSGTVTTSFGRRPVNYAALQRDALAQQMIPAVSAIDKWAIFKTISDARQRLGLQDRSLTVLHALLSFHPGNELKAGEQLVVFPSNVQLINRAHGIASATLRRHLALLVETGIVRRRDSANGKRYARKNEKGTVEQAFGFDLSPLLARASEFASLAQEVTAEKQALRTLREDITIRRRDIRKVIVSAMEAGAQGHWPALHDTYERIIGALPRQPDLATLRLTITQLDALFADLLNLMTLKEKVEIPGSNVAHDERHIEESKSESIPESEAITVSDSHSPESRENKPESEAQSADGVTVTRHNQLYPLDMIVKACPEIIAYASGGEIRTNQDLIRAAHLVRTCLDISSTTYQRAVNTLGEQGAAVAIACILGRATHVQSPGAYLQSLVTKAYEGRFTLAPMLFARIRAANASEPTCGNADGSTSKEIISPPSERLLQSLGARPRIASPFQTRAVEAPAPWYKT